MSQQEKGSTASSGRWEKSYRRREVRADVKALVQEVGRSGANVGEAAPGMDCRLLKHFVLGRKGSLKVNEGKDGTVWYKVAWPLGPNMVYVLVGFPEACTFAAALVELCQVLVEVDWGLRKPTVDKYAARNW